MRHILPFAILSLVLFSGCAKDLWHKNHLTNLTDKQADWFDRTSQGWRFEDGGSQDNGSGTTQNNGSSTR